MGAINRFNSVQFENLNVNELVGVTLVYKSVNRNGETHYSGVNFAGDEYTPKDKTQDEIFRVCLAEQSDCTNNRNDNISGVYYIS